ncbi:MAG: hypothetical protein AAGM67_05160 [Bacteroidota bacterium]
MKTDSSQTDLTFYYGYYDRPNPHIQVASHSFELEVRSVGDPGSLSDRELDALISYKEHLLRCVLEIDHQIEQHKKGMASDE